MSDLERFIARLEQLITRVETVLPPVAPEPNWSASAFRWRGLENGSGYLQGVKHPHRVDLDALKNIDTQKNAWSTTTQAGSELFPKVCSGKHTTSEKAVRHRPFAQRTGGW